MECLIEQLECLRVFPADEFQSAQTGAACTRLGKVSSHLESCESLFQQTSCLGEVLGAHRTESLKPTQNLVGISRLGKDHP